MTKLTHVACAILGLALSVVAPAMAATTPFSGTPVSVPGQIDAEKFDNGGEGVAYHDTTAGNSGGQFRNTNVDIEAASEGGYDVGWTAAGEWLNYTVNVASAGTYTINLRVASPSGASLHVGFNTASNVWKVVSVPNTGGWQNWTTVSFTATLGAGAQQMTILFDNGGMNLRNVVVSGAGGGGGGVGGLSPVSGTPVSIPGTVQAANFDNGGEGVAYHDTTAGNSGGAYRTTDVDVEQASDGGYDVAWIAAGEWLNYTVNVASAGTYTVNLRVASPGGASMHVGFNNASNIWRVVSIPKTGDWQNWVLVSFTASLGAGTQQMTLFFDTGGMNIESIAVASPGPLPPSSTGGVIAVTVGADLQAAIDNAQPGDTIVLQAGATFTGNFVLPAKPGSAYVTITSSGDRSRLPGDNTRIDPSYSPLLAKIQSPNSAPAIATAPFAHHYQLQLLEFLPTFQGLYDIIELGDGNQNTLDIVPHDIVVDRVYIHGDPTFGQKRGIALNSASTTIKNSYIAGIVGVNMDTQAICGWNGPGPFTIANNYLEASGENLLFGGTDPAVPNLVPSDITITHNQLSKLWSWWGQAWTVKNLLEFKNAQRVVVDGNILENNWEAGQDYAVQFTPRNQDGTAWWTVVQQIQFTNNVVRHVAAGIAILGSDYNATSQQTNSITIRNNLFEDVSSAHYGGNGWYLLMLGASANITVDHNTIFSDGSSDIYADGAPSPGFVFTNNIMQNNAYAIMGNSSSPGNGTIAMFFPRSQFFGSVIAGANPASYPGGNFYPPSLSAVGFVNLGGGNYRLSASSPFIRSATDGADVGANIDAINAAAGTQY